MSWEGDARGKKLAPLAGSSVSAQAMRYRRRRGGFIIIWGSRSLASPDPMVAPIYRRCPGCRQNANLVGMISERWFTLFFCPIFPIGSERRRFVQCSSCGRKFVGAGTNRPVDAVVASLEQVAGVLPGQETGPLPTRRSRPKSLLGILLMLGVCVVLMVLVGVGLAVARKNSEETARAQLMRRNANYRSDPNYFSGVPERPQVSRAADGLKAVPQHPQIQNATDALNAMNSHDINWGAEGYDWLKRAEVDPANRAAVLKYLRPFLTSNPADRNRHVGDQTERIGLFCKWADNSCTRDLLALLDADFRDVRPAENAFTALARVAPDVAETELRKRWDDEKKAFIPRMLARWRSSRDPTLSSEGAKMERELVAWAEFRRRSADRQKRAQDEADHALTPEHIAEWLESSEPQKRRYGLTELPQVEIPGAQRERIHKALCAIIAGDKTPVFRRDAARYLVDFGQSADVALLTEMANEPDAGKLYGSAAAAGVMLLDPTAGLKILDAHSSESRYVIDVANELGHHREKGERAGLAMLESSHSETRQAALRLLGGVGSKASLVKIKAAQAAEPDEKLQQYYKWTIINVEKR